MIRIIRHGQRIRLVECKHCHCLFEFTDDEINYEGDMNLRVKCPDCGELIAFAVAD